MTAIKSSYAPKIVVATGNRKKGVEMQTILADSGLEVYTIADFPHVDFEVEETGCTYAENSEFKAVAAVSLTGMVSVADDAGLEIDALGGQPGVYSKRFLGEHTPFPEKMHRILHLLKDTPIEERKCRFICAVVIATPDGKKILCDGVCEGIVGWEMKGEYGFGYDPIFYLPELGKYMAELPPEKKHLISHRGKALAKVKVALAELFGLKS